MKTFIQTFTRSTNNAVQQILSLVYAALSFTREVTLGQTTGGFFVFASAALVGANSVCVASSQVRRDTHCQFKFTSFVFLSKES
jgi:hypothetical protein